MDNTDVLPPRRIIIGISGASGFGYGVAALRALSLLDLTCDSLPRWGETHHLITGEHHYDHRSLD